jgi:RNA-directed DNA polymerase
MSHKKTLFGQMIALDHLFLCWKQFRIGKRKRTDVQAFERHLEDHIFELYRSLQEDTYQHKSYWKFYVFDPKERHISKAHVRDRLVHHMLYNILESIYDKQFIFHSYACRKNKGTHLGITHLNRMLRKVSKNNKQTAYALKMDIKRFFDTVSHNRLKELLSKKIQDEKVLNILSVIIDSFHVTPGRGLPLGNVTSQIFSNIYLHELDQFIKHVFKESFYLRYCDDFVIISSDENHLKNLIPQIEHFLETKLQLELHPKKVILKKWSSGIDFLGYISFPNHQIMRTSTKKRMLKRLSQRHESYLEGKITENTLDQSLQSYLGMLTYTRQKNLATTLKNAYWGREEIFSEKGFPNSHYQF